MKKREKGIFEDMSYTLFIAAVLMNCIEIKIIILGTGITLA